MIDAAQAVRDSKLIVPDIPAFDDGAAAAARAHQDRLTKPAGSLGRLEELAIWYAGVRGDFPADVPRRAALFIFAGDHGVCAEGVSAFPAAVTPAMVANFQAGGAAVSVLAREAGVQVTVVDVGVAADLPPTCVGSHGAQPGATVSAGDSVAPLRDERIRRGTGNIAREPAMSHDEARRAIAVGVRLAGEAADQRIDVLCGGEMGIGNTTAAAALICALGGVSPDEIVGRGTGVDDQGLARKLAAVRRALALHRPSAEDPVGALALVGGLEIAALVGLMLGGAARRIPVVVDGFIAGAAALAAVRLRPAVRRYLLLSHLSAERGAGVLCKMLGGPAPLFDLGLRLGEGTGACLAVPLLRSAVAAQSQMATFAGAAVPGPREA